MGEIRENLKRNLGYYLSLTGISQKKLAEKLGVSQSAVTNWVKGKNSPDIEVVAEICKIFGISITDLMGKTMKQDSQTNPTLQLHEQVHLKKYHSLNESGQRRVDDYMEDLITTGRYSILDNIPIPDMDNIREDAEVCSDN